jgi:hypothetical protein
MKKKTQTKSELAAEIDRLNRQAMNDLARINSLSKECNWNDIARYRYKIALERIAEIDNGSVACEIAQKALEENE